MAYCTRCGRTIVGDEPSCRACGAPVPGPAEVEQVGGPPVGPETPATGAPTQRPSPTSATDPYRGDPALGPTPTPMQPVGPSAGASGLPPPPFPPGPPPGASSMPPPGMPPPGPSGPPGPPVHRVGPSRALMIVAAAALAAVVVLSVLLAKRHAEATPQPVFNPTQIAIERCSRRPNRSTAPTRTAFLVAKL